MYYDSAMVDAIKLAQKARGQTAPNPLVGAVLINKNGEIVAQGHHPKAGEPHAEVFAIREALEKGLHLEDLTLVVSLEPCNHFGKTPPCTEAIIKAGINTVVVGTLDPNPLVQGKGIQRLRDAGVSVITGIRENECGQLIRGFKSSIEKGRPFVTLKCAVSLDGKIATLNGESKWITGEPARRFVHEKRAQHDAILVGVNTVINDDPELNIRFGIPHNPLKKIILDSKLRTPISSKVFQSEGEVYIFTSKKSSASKYAGFEAEVIAVNENDNGLDLSEVLRELNHMGVQELFVEGGARVIGSFLQSNVCDQILYFIAPKILGSQGKDVFVGYDAKSLAAAIQLKDLTYGKIGDDLFIEGTPCLPA